MTKKKFRHIISSNFKWHLVKSVGVGTISTGLTVQSSSKRCSQLSMHPRPSAQWFPNVSLEPPVFGITCVVLPKVSTRRRASANCDDQVLV